MTQDTTLPIPITIPDGIVTTYVRFRDDLGNTSEPVLLASIVKDATIPSGTVKIQNVNAIEGVGDVLASNNFFVCSYRSG